jgi:hypothetical protein
MQEKRLKISISHFLRSCKGLVRGEEVGEEVVRAFQNNVKRYVSAGDCPDEIHDHAAHCVKSSEYIC